jgi:hypothetical protein
MRIFYGLAIAAAFTLGAFMAANVKGIGPMEWVLMAGILGAGIPQLTRLRVSAREQAR